MGEEKICILGLGYVGLPLALEFAKYFSAVGFDLQGERIGNLQSDIDSTGEVDSKTLEESNLKFTDNIRHAADCTVYILAVPTPVNADKSPDLGHLRTACESVAEVLKRGDLVIVESTVYPGCTDEFCAPLLGRLSGLKPGEDFDYGYSPERIRPSSRWKSPVDIAKLVAGSGPAATARVDALYQRIIEAGTYRTGSIRVAEMSKLTENIQRDVNIALMNELAIICKHLDISSSEVFDAAATKWDFHNYRPGLVGGHCIGVDPYYLVHQARAVDAKTELIDTARRINENMVAYVAQQSLKLLASRGESTAVGRKQVLVLGLSFKEDCPDLRNSMVFRVIRRLESRNHEVTACDPLADAARVQSEYGIRISTDHLKELCKPWDLIVFAVRHKAFDDIEEFMLGEAMVVDIKGGAPRADWRL